MAISSLGLGRPAESKNRIVEDFRTRIVNGELVPGSRFPTRSEIEQQYGAGPVTVHRALESLKEAGFIKVHGRRGGTFVADNPPHLSRYAVVFPSLGMVGYFWDAISSEVKAISSERPDCQLVPYYNVNGHNQTQTFLQLRQEVLEHRIAGIIFTSHPFMQHDTPLLDEPDIPRVAIMEPEPATCSLPLVWADMYSFLTVALDELRQRGHRRIAIIQNIKGLFSQEYIDEALAERDMETRPYWCLNMPFDAPTTTRNCVNLLMHCSELPDALLICDDGVVESASAGLLDAQTRIPKGFEVIAHSNFPHSTPCLYPARRLGFDVRQLLLQCVDNLNAQCRGEAVPYITRFPAHFEGNASIPTY